VLTRRRATSGPQSGGWSSGQHLGGPCLGKGSKPCKHALGSVTEGSGSGDMACTDIAELKATPSISAFSLSPRGPSPPRATHRPSRSRSARRRRGELARLQPGKHVQASPRYRPYGRGSVCFRLRSSPDREPAPAKGASVRLSLTDEGDLVWMSCGIVALSGTSS
jgi:hypothetical protein